MVINDWSSNSKRYVVRACKKHVMASIMISNYFLPGNMRVNGAHYLFCHHLCSFNYACEISSFKNIVVKKREENKRSYYHVCIMY